MPTDLDTLAQRITSMKRRKVDPEISEFRPKTMSCGHCSGFIKENNNDPELHTMVIKDEDNNSLKCDSSSISIMFIQ